MDTMVFVVLYVVVSCCRGLDDDVVVVVVVVVWLGPTTPRCWRSSSLSSSLLSGLT